MMFRPLLAVLTASALFAAPACSAEEVQDAPDSTAAEAAPEPEITAAPEEAPQEPMTFPDDVWRPVAGENLLRIVTSQGTIYVELAPEFAPNHVARMKQLARAGFYAGTVWHRVIEDFVAQGGGRFDNPNFGYEDEPPLQAEFTLLRGPELTISELQERAINPRLTRAEAQAGFWRGFPVGTQPIAQAAIRADGQVESWLLHCEGAAAMARTDDPNSARSQFYITRGDPDFLNADYTVWGRVRAGQAVVNALKTGTLGADMQGTPDRIDSVDVVADLPVEDQPRIEVIDTDSQAFADYLAGLAEENGGALPDICAIDVPVRVSLPG